MKTSSIPKGKITFVSWHNYLDQSNGASISTRELLLELARRGWDVSTLCAFSDGTYSDHEQAFTSAWGYVENVDGTYNIGGKQGTKRF